MSDKAMKKVSKSLPEITRSRARSLARDEGGAVAVMFALMLVALFGMMALAMDLGKVWNLETELQHAADACALAGVTQLDGTDGARARAIEACVADLAPPLVDNEQRFASDGLGSDVTFSKIKTIDPDGYSENPDIKFYTVLPTIPANLAPSDAEARFIEANVAPRRVDFSFAAVIGAVTSASPSARAVAGWEHYYCDTPTMMMCNPAETVNAAGDSNGEGFDIDSSCPDYGDGRGTSCVGRGVTMREHGSGSQLFPGEFGFLSLSVLDSYGNILEKVVGKKVLEDALAAVINTRKCTGNYVQTEPGDMESLNRWINMRFDMYYDAKRYDANYQPAKNAVKDYVLAPGWTVADRCRFNTTAGAPDPGSSDWLLPDNKYDGPGHHMTAGFSDVDITDATGNPLDAMGYPRDYCAYLSEAQALPLAQQPQSTILDAYVTYLDTDIYGGEGGCVFAPPKSLEGVFADADQIGSGQWDMWTYLELHHPTTLAIKTMPELVALLDLPNNLTEGAASKDGFISRWEVYQFELTVDYPDYMPDGGVPSCYADMDVMAGADTYLPDAPPMPTLDRRIMLMAIVNCADVKAGRRVVPRVSGDGTIALFMTEPVGAFDSGALYGEIVHPLGLAGAGDLDATPQLIRDLIVLIQ